MAREIVEIDLSALEREQVEAFKVFTEDLLNDDPYNTELESVLSDISFYIENLETTDDFIIDEEEY